MDILVIHYLMDMHAYVMVFAPAYICIHY